MIPVDLRRRSHLIWTTSVFVTAFAVRLWAIGRSFPDQEFFGKYLALGQELLSNGMIAVRPFSYAPIYCYFIAGCRSVFGESLYPILVVQALIGSGTCVLIYRIGRRLLGDRWALAPAAIACVYRSFVLYDGTFLSDSLGLFLLLGLVSALYRLNERPTLLGYAGIGGLLGLAILYRPNNLLLLVLVIAALAIQRVPARTLATRAAVTVAAAAIVASPVLLQNARLTGTPGVTASNPGYIFYSSNNPYSYGFWYSPPELYSQGTRYYQTRAARAGRQMEAFVGDAEIAAAISGAVTGSPMSLRNSSRYYLGFTLDHIGRYPAHYAGLFLAKLALAFNAVEPHDILPALLRDRRVASITPMTYGVVVPLGLLGLGLSAFRWRRYVWLYLILINQLALLVLFYVVVRFRLPVEAVMILMCGVALKTGWEAVRDRRVRSLLIGGLALAILVGATQVMTPSMRQRFQGKRLDYLFEFANQTLQHGKPQLAAELLHSIVENDTEYLPRGFRSHQLLERLYREFGVPTPNDARLPAPRIELEPAIATLQRKLEAGAATFQEIRFLAFLQRTAEDWPGAEATLVHALGDRPFAPVLRYDLAVARLNLGRPDDAVEETLRAIDNGLLFTVQGTSGCLLLAETLRARGATADADRWLAQAVRQSILFPWYADDEEARAVLTRLRATPGYSRPGELSELLPTALGLP